MNLRLRENAFVRGQFTPAGTVFEFTKQEAEHRLSRTRLWDIS
ncbi:MAG: hypothetical protein JWP89_2640 [Schlesneria sp.]|nr:hypothetical protein [Schlesneria sp.]